MEFQTGQEGSQFYSQHRHSLWRRSSYGREVYVFSDIMAGSVYTIVQILELHWRGWEGHISL